MFGIKNSTLIHGAINLVVGVSTYGISSAIIKNNTAEPETLASKAALATGSFVISTMVAEKATMWVDRQFNIATRVVEEVNKIQTDTESDPK